MSYLEFFGFEKEPFSTAPDTRFYFESDEHKQAILRIHHAVENMKGLAVIVGDVGAGKTMLARHMLEALDEDEYEVALLVIVHSQISVDWFLKKIAMQIGIEEVPSDKVEVLSTISARLMELHESGRKAVVMVDEAQMLNSREIMEEIRGLLNIELPDRKLITFVLFGLPDLDEVLKLDPPLAQRVAIKYRLRPFEEQSTRKYIEHRLKLAGASNTEIFDDAALRLIHAASGGIPRKINTICDNALFEAFLLKKKSVDEEIVREVIEDLGFEPGEMHEIATEESVRDGEAMEIEESDEIEDIVESIEEIGE